jgi:uncharacterized membrane protein YfcA
MFDGISFVILIAIGIVGGIFGSLIGVGGGIIFAPILTLLGLNPSQTSSTSLIAVTSTSISSVFSYSQQRRIKYKFALSLAVLSIPGAVLGVYLSTVISIEFFQLLFSIIIILAAVYILFSNRIKEGKGLTKSRLNSYFLMYLCAFTAGIVSSLFGVGGGIIYVPIMLILKGMNMYEAAPSSQFIILISAVTGLIFHIIMGHPDYVYGLSLALGALAGGLLGSKLLGRIREGILRIFLSMSLFFVSGKLIFDVINDFS